MLDLKDEARFNHALDASGSLRSEVHILPEVLEGCRGSFIPCRRVITDSIFLRASFAIALDCHASEAFLF